MRERSETCVESVKDCVNGERLWIGSRKNCARKAFGTLWESGRKLFGFKHDKECYLAFA